MRHELKSYAVSTLITAAIVFAVFDLRHCDLKVPLYDKLGGDMLGSLVWFKTIQETGWVHVNRHLGAPGVMDLYDFPAPQVVNHLVMKGLVATCGNPVLAHNLFFLLGFLLTSWSATFVLRHFGISAPVAVAVGLLFSFLPVHFWRGTWHLTLSFYPAVPLGVLLCLWICEERPLFTGGGEGWNRRGPLSRSAASIAIAALMAGSGVYNAWFMGFFLIVSGLIVWLRRPRMAPPLDATICLSMLVGVVALQAVPYAVHRRTHEPAPLALIRSPGVSQSNGLPVAELVLPTIGHRIPAWRVVESRRSIGHGDDPRSPDLGQRLGINEKYYHALGLIGSAGFLFLCIALLAPEAGWLRPLRPAADLARLNIAGVLLGSGFALLFEYFVPQIRAYCRIGTYIAFFSLFGAALLADRLRPHDPASPRASFVFLLAVCAVTALGLLDEIPGVMTPDHRAQAASFADEAAYVRKVESLLAPGALVFELPYTDYPEPREPAGSVSNDHFRPYLHSKRLRWSYGASRGTKADLWQREAAKLDLARMTAELCRAGFTGLHVDLLAYHDKAATIRADLDRELGTPDVTAKQGRWRFYRLDCSSPGGGAIGFCSRSALRRYLALIDSRSFRTL
jgi:phosphoglycerol transferase